MLKAEDIIKESMSELKELMSESENVFFKNHEKVLAAFKKNRVGVDCFQGTTGYGYNDYGREVLNKVYQDVFRGEAALVSSHFLSGTHTLHTVLKSLLKKNQKTKVVSLGGPLYDTFKNALTDPEGLIAQGRIDYKEVELTKEGNLDLEIIASSALDGVDIALLQRSKGYSLRKSFSIEEIAKATKTIKEKHPQITIFVDNCYGELVEEREPLEVGADIIAGSLIKNPGGTLVSTGGYVVGRKDLIESVAQEFTVPGIGGEIGATDGVSLRLMFQGLYLAPKIVAEGIYGAIYASLLFSKMGYQVEPLPGSKRTDMVQSIFFHSEEELIRFCQLVQENSAVDSFVTPYPWEMPGYEHEVIMASGSFIAGSSSEFSADAPLKPPYVAFLQGGVSLSYNKIALDKMVRSFVK